jgi:hypothetical protein
MSLSIYKNKNKKNFLYCLFLFDIFNLYLNKQKYLTLMFALGPR